MTRLRSEGVLLLVTLVWGATFVIIKHALNDVSASVFVFARFSLALVVGVAIWPGIWKHLNVETLRRGLILGVLFGAGFLLQSVGLVTTSASTSAFITGTMVVFIPFVFKLVVRSAIRPIHWISVVAVVVGLWLFTQPDVMGINIGDSLTLASAVLWAFYVVYIDVWTKGEHTNNDELHLLVVLQFVSTIILSVVATLMFDAEPFAVSVTQDVVLAVLYCALLASVFTTWAQTRFQKFVHPVRAGVIFALEPIVASLFAWWAIGEQWNTRQLGGALVLLTAIVVPDIIIERQNRRDKK